MRPANEHMPPRLRGCPLWLPCDRCGEVAPMEATEFGLLCPSCDPGNPTVRPTQRQYAYVARRQLPTPELRKTTERLRIRPAA